MDIQQLGSLQEILSPALMQIAISAVGMLAVGILLMLMLAICWWKIERLKAQNEHLRAENEHLQSQVWYYLEEAENELIQAQIDDRKARMRR